MKYAAFLFLLVGFTHFAAGQSQKVEHFFSLNGNTYSFLGETKKGAYPILWYDNDTDAKLLIGGLGFGYSGLKRITEDVLVKGQTNLSRHIFWEEPINFLDDRGISLGHYVFSTTNFTIGLAATVHYVISDRFFIGTGLGTQVLLASVTKRPPIATSANSEIKKRQLNKHFRTLQPTVPLELTVKTKRKLYNIRYEYPLGSVYKNELGEQQKEGFGIFTFELGFKLGAGKKSVPD